MRDGALSQPCSSPGVIWLAAGAPGSIWPSIFRGLPGARAGSTRAEPGYARVASGGTARRWSGGPAGIPSSGPIRPGTPFASARTSSKPSGSASRALDPELVVPPEADRRCAARLEAADLPVRGFVLVNPFTRWPSKSWPVDRYQELIDRLGRDQDAPVVVHAGPGEEAGLDAFRPTEERRAQVGVVGGLPLEESLALFRRARLMVTADTGPMHCAAALGVPVVALFGPTWPERTGPWGQRHRVIQCARPPTHHTFGPISKGGTSARSTWRPSAGRCARRWRKPPGLRDRVAGQNRR